jgi:sugar phosphate permease
MIRDNPILLGLMTLDLLAVFFGGVVALLPIFAKDILGIGPVGLGLLRSSPAVGALLMAVVMARFPVKRAAGRMIFAGVAVYGVATIIFGLSSSVVLSVVCMLALGAGDMLSQVLRQTIIQIRIPDEMRGRVAAVSSLSVNVGGQLGMFESGVTAAWFGAVGSVLFGGVAVLAIVVIWMWRFPTLRDIETPEEGQPPAPSSGKETG